MTYTRIPVTLLVRAAAWSAHLTLHSHRQDKSNAETSRRYRGVGSMRQVGSALIHVESDQAVQIIPLAGRFWLS